LYYEQVFDMHGVTKEEYEKNIGLLSKDELRIGAVADSAIALLKRMSEQH
jgi:hypothetical protein